MRDPGRVHLAYIDESYDLERFVLAVVLVRPEHVPAICARLDDEVTWAHETFGVPREAELHAHQVLQGMGVWSTLRHDVRVRLRVAERILSALAACDVRILVFSISAPDGDGSPLNAAEAYRVCLDSAIRALEQEAQTTLNQVLVVADEVSGADDYRDHVLRWRRDASNFDSPSALLDVIYFVPSRSSRMIQAADMVAYLARRARNEIDRAEDRRSATALWEVVANSATWISIAGNASAPGDRG